MPPVGSEDHVPHGLAPRQTRDLATVLGIADLALETALTVRLLWNLGVLSIEADASEGDVPTGAEEKKS